MTALVQLGLMPEYLPYPYLLPGGTQPSTGHKFEYRVPGASRETAEKMRDKNSVDSNQMFEYRIREVNE
jgi:carboxymethylenebutenolidase